MTSTDSLGNLYPDQRANNDVQFQHTPYPLTAHYLHEWNITQEGRMCYRIGSGTRLQVLLPAI